MPIHTLMPNASDYGVMIVMLLSAGSFVIANHIYTRGLQSFDLNIITANVGVKSVIVLFGFLIVPAAALFGDLNKNLILGLFCAYPLGWSVAKLDKAMIRLFFRNKQWHKQYVDKNRAVSENNISHQRILSLCSKKITEINQHTHVRNKYVKEVTNKNIKIFSLFSVLSVAVLEEILFRGFLVYFCLNLFQGYVSVFMLALSMVIFCFSHIGLGVEQVIAKIPLTIITTTTQLFFGTLLIPIIVHMTLNFKAYQESLQS